MKKFLTAYVKQFWVFLVIWGIIDFQMWRQFSDIGNESGTLVASLFVGVFTLLLPLTVVLFYNYQYKNNETK